jgi:hypothetical protein
VWDIAKRATALLLVGLTACGQLATATSMQSARVAQPSRVRAVGEPSITLQLSAAVPTVAIEVVRGQPCIDERVTLIERRQVTENTAPGNWGNFAWAFALGAISAASFIVASTMSDVTTIDPTTGAEEASPQSVTYGLGALAGLGSLFGFYFGISKAIAARDVYQQLPSELEVLPGPARTCDAQPVPNAELSLGTPGGARSLGRTGRDGRLRLNLVQVAGADLFTGTAELAYPLRVNGQSVGRPFDVSVFRAWQHDGAWRAVEASPDPELLQAFARDYPESAHAAEAHSRAATILEDAAWGDAERADRWQAYTSFVERFPSSARVIVARERMRDGYLAALLPEGVQALAEDNLDRAGEVSRAVTTVAPTDPRVVELAAGVRRVQEERAERVAREARDAADRAAREARDAAVRDIQAALNTVGAALRDRQIWQSVRSPAAGAHLRGADGQIAEACERARAALARVPPVAGGGAEPLEARVERSCQGR